MVVVAAGVLEELIVWRFEFDGDVIVISRRIGFAGISYCNYVTSLPRQRKLTLDLRTRGHIKYLQVSRRNILFLVAEMPRSEEAEFWFNAVYEAVQEIPRGRVTSYGHIALLLGARTSH
jgi:hypothetical protein